MRFWHIEQYIIYIADDINLNFLKAVFHKFHLVHSWIYCLIWHYVQTGLSKFFNKYFCLDFLKTSYELPFAWYSFYRIYYSIFLIQSFKAVIFIGYRWSFAIFLVSFLSEKEADKISNKSTWKKIFFFDYPF